MALKNKDYNSALRYYSNAKNLSRNTSIVIGKRIVEINLKKGDIPEALDEIVRLGDKAEKDTQLLRLKAGILANNREYDKAINAYNKLGGELDNETRLFLASLYAQKPDLESAKQQVLMVLEEEPENAFANYYYAKILLSLIHI